MTALGAVYLGRRKSGLNTGGLPSKGQGWVWTPTLPHQPPVRSVCSGEGYPHWVPLPVRMMLFSTRGLDACDGKAGLLGFAGQGTAPSLL